MVIFVACPRCRGFNTKVIDKRTIKCDDCGVSIRV